jgi:hypothetical protein
MSETAQELVDRMVAAGEWPEPDLVEQILARGDEAVEPLRAVVRREVHGWPEEAPLSNAVGLLGMLRARAAIPDLVELFRHYDNETVEDAEDTLSRLGPEAVEPALAVVRDPSLTYYPRTKAASAAQKAAGGDAELRGRVATTLREQLADLVARAKDLNEDQLSLATMLVGTLVNLADPEARELIGAAFDADIVDRMFMVPEDVDRCYREGPRPDRLRETPWLDEYRQRYAERLRPEEPPSDEDEGPGYEPPGWSQPAYPPYYEEPRPQPVRNTGPKIGRNDPCWCGSGKKYKNCHLRQDQA